MEGYRLENKPVDLSCIKELTFVPSQRAGDVYRFRNYALRIFQDGEKVIDEDKTRFWSNKKINEFIKANPNIKKFSLETL